MIRMVKGTYGLPTEKGVVAMTPKSGAFSLSDEREAELVKAGVAVKADEAKEQKKSASRAKKKVSKAAEGTAAAAESTEG